jgi:hypothetical protein
VTGYKPKHPKICETDSDNRRKWRKQKQEFVL